jgi:hypothetical protein
MMLLLINGAPARPQPHTPHRLTGRLFRAVPRDENRAAEAAVPRRHDHLFAIGVNATAATGTAVRYIVDLDADVG